MVIVAERVLCVDLVSSECYTMPARLMLVALSLLKKGFKGQRSGRVQRTGWFKGQRTGWFKGQRTGRFKGQSTGRVQRTKDREGSEHKGQGGFKGQESSKPIVFDRPVSCDCGTVTTDWYSVTSCLLQGGFKPFSVRWSSFF